MPFERVVALEEVFDAHPEPAPCLHVQQLGKVIAEFHGESAFDKTPLLENLRHRDEGDPRTGGGQFSGDVFVPVPELGGFVVPSTAGGVFRRV